MCVVYGDISLYTIYIVWRTLLEYIACRFVYSHSSVVKVSYFVKTTRLIKLCIAHRFVSGKNRVSYRVYIVCASCGTFWHHTLYLYLFIETIEIFAFVFVTVFTIFFTSDDIKIVFIYFCFCDFVLYLSTTRKYNVQCTSKRMDVLEFIRSEYLHCPW